MNPGITADSIYLLTDPPSSAARNMAVDELLFRKACAEGAVIMRLYSWDRPSVTAGYFQDVRSEMDLDLLAAEKVPLVRRMTGGRAVLHGGDLAYSFSSAGNAILPFIKRTVFCFISRLLSAGLSAAGYASRIKERAGRAYASNPDCFRSVSEYELTGPSGVKLAGSAQYMTEQGVMQQGTVPLDRSHTGISRFFLERTGHPVPPSGIGYPDRTLLAGGIVKALEGEFRTVIRNGLEPDEKAVKKLIADKYGNPEWNLNRQKNRV